MLVEMKGVVEEVNGCGCVGWMLRMTVVREWRVRMTGSCVEGKGDCGSRVEDLSDCGSCVDVVDC